MPNRGVLGVALTPADVLGQGDEGLHSKNLSRIIIRALDSKP